MPPSLSSENDAKVDDVVEEKVKAEEVLVAEEKDKEKDEVKGVEEAVVVEEKEKEKEEEKEEEKEKEKEEEVTVGETESESLKEESNRVSDSERKGIEELKKVVREELERKEEGEVSIWGVPLFKDQRTDVILLKFLRARDLRVNDALVMIQNTLRWRKEFGIDALLEEDLGEELEKVVFMHGHGREGHPVCYNVYGEFQNKELYQKAFSTEENRTKFLRWRIQLLERSIRNLDFTPGGINTIFQVNDLKNSPGPAKRELRLATKQALQLLQDNYPEFVAKQVSFSFQFLRCFLRFYFTTSDRRDRDRADLHQCPLVVSCIQYHDQSLLDSEDQKQIYLCWTIQVSRYSFQVSHSSTLLNNNRHCHLLFPTISYSLLSIII